jgi:hypothetical protein
VSGAASFFWSVTHSKIALPLRAAASAELIGAPQAAGLLIFIATPDEKTQSPSLSKAMSGVHHRGEKIEKDQRFVG